MKKYFISLLLIVSMVTTLCLGQNTVQAAVLPKIKMVTQPQATYNKKDVISFAVYSPSYRSRVEYRVRLYNSTTKKTTYLWNTPNTGYYYKKSQPLGISKFSIRFGASQLQPGTYTMTIYVRRANSNVSYDSYVNARTFTVKDTTAVSPNPTLQDLTLWGLVPNSGVNDDVFNKANINQISSFGTHYEVANGEMLFKDEWTDYGTNKEDGYSNYKIKTIYNPLIEKQVFELTKALIDDGAYTDSGYYMEEDKSLSPFAYVTFESVPNAFESYFQFTFSENFGDSYSSKGITNAFMLLYVSHLSSDGGPTIEPYYSNQLNKGMDALFGKSLGDSIFNFVLTHHKDLLKNIGTPVTTSGTFGHIKVTFNTDGYRQWYYFNYIK